jgi:murein L,D-transpeptidase YcbB/YkuD
MEAQDLPATPRPAPSAVAKPIQPLPASLNPTAAALRSHWAKIEAPSTAATSTPFTEWYASRGFEPAWSPAMANALIKYGGNLRQHGLESFLFDLASIRNAWNAPRNTDRVEDIAQRDVKTTQLAHRVIQTLAGGLIDPASLHPKWKTLPPRVTQPFSLIERALVLDPDELAAMFDRAVPKNAHYQRMMATLTRYREITALGGWRSLPDPGKTLRAGESYAGTGLLRARLRAEGDLPDTASKIVPATYDAETEAAVKAFQFRHGITPDGVVGPQTFTELNAPVNHRITALIVNLERLRWLPDPDITSQVPRIEVNIAESALRMYRGNLRIETLRVIVGKKGKHQTPIFHGDIQYLIFRPYWNVPAGIARKEIGPIATDDPDYLARNNYEIVPAFGVAPSAALPIRADTVAAMIQGRYSLRQASGPKNALGLVKFIFPNDSAVYLHDTPNRALFDRTDRDFSHGCVRVSNPARLAEFTLKPNGDWSQQRIDAALNNNQRPNQQINLKAPLPVYLTYRTATILNDGRVRFDQDIYEHDRPLRAKLGLGAAERTAEKPAAARP